MKRRVTIENKKTLPECVRGVSRKSSKRKGLNSAVKRKVSHHNLIL